MIKTYNEYLALRIKLGMSTKEFDKLIGIGKQTKYAWKKAKKLSSLYQILSSILDEKPELFMKAVNNKVILDYESFRDFEKSVVEHVGAKRFYIALNNLSEHAPFRWEVHGIKYALLLLLNLMFYDFDTVYNVSRKIHNV